MTNDTNELTHKIIGCAMKVHNVLGSGFLEVIYQKALAIEMRKAGLPFEQEREFSIFYDGELIGSRRVDFFVANVLMLELKARPQVENIHKNQAINYLEVHRIADGLLINFGGPSLEFKRVYNKKLVTPGENPIV
ncbi:GxxExxY protein [Mucilaginibacter flavidus]|uniref:GxxExxY protein n=1 Tax=Mucilaginibacter flavidus TaxID=2949309 RepID=UPI0020928D84|nr:GxxExxY protein [Mucilaginibacter flavidus]MCO5946883.1 GxxExxY protein [Mucilaginibacter flavidus]